MNYTLGPHWTSYKWASDYLTSTQCPLINIISIIGYQPNFLYAGSPLPTSRSSSSFEVKMRPGTARFGSAVMKSSPWRLPRLLRQRLSSSHCSLYSSRPTVSSDVTIDCISTLKVNTAMLTRAKFSGLKIGASATSIQAS